MIGNSLLDIGHSILKLHLRIILAAQMPKLASNFKVYSRFR